jgi:hypothetical protein
MQSKSNTDPVSFKVRHGTQRATLQENFSGSRAIKGWNRKESPVNRGKFKTREVHTEIKTKAVSS